MKHTSIIQTKQTAGPMSIATKCLPVLAIFIAAGLPMQAQSELTVLGATSTQTVIAYQAPSRESICKIALSEKEDFSVLVNDVDPTLFPESDLDSRSLVKQSQGRLVVLGKRAAEPSGSQFYSRALRNGTTHYLRITCDGNTAASVMASLSTVAADGFVPDPLPFHPAAYGNMAVPDFDWSDRSKPVIDPQTGVAIYRVADPKDFSSNAALNFSDYFGGDNWTNPGNIVSGSTSSVARTSSTSPIFVLANTTQIHITGGFANTATLSHPATDMAIQLFGSATGSAAQDRMIEICISVDSGQSCYTPPRQVTLPSGNAQDIGLTPSSFPNPLFAGWNKVVPREYFPSQGSVTVAAGLVTLTKDDQGTPLNWTMQSAKSRFQHEWAVGSRIYIANSSPTCPSNFCTISQINSYKELQLVEALTLGENQYRFAGLGFRIQKVSNNNEVKLSASYRVAKSFMLHQSPFSGCSISKVTTNVSRTGGPISKPITGYLCLFSWVFDSGGRLYFVGESEPEIRMLALFKQPSSIPGHLPADVPFSLTEVAMGNLPAFDPDDPNVFFTATRTAGGSMALFKLTYTGDYRENSDAFWNSKPDSTPARGLDNIQWKNTTKSEDQHDLRTQILAKTTYTESQWGNLTTSLNFAGFTPAHSIFYSSPISGQDTPCWIFAFDSKSGDLTKSWNTLNRIPAGSRAAGCHSVQLAAGRIMLALSPLKLKDSSRAFGGPFDVTVTGVRRGGAMTSNTSLTWQGNLTEDNYDRTCPSDMQPYAGALPGSAECVTLKIPREPCSSYATVSEKQWSPCPGDASKSWIGAPVAAGDQFYDPAAPIDSESFMVVSRRDVSDGIELVLIRDSALGYACQLSNPRGRSCLGYPGQQVHVNGWKMVLLPRGGGVTLVDPLSGVIQQEDPNLTRGHFSYDLLKSGNHSFAGIGSSGKYVARYDAKSAEFGQPQTSSFAQWPQFAGSPGDMSGYVQSYITVGGAAANGFDRRFAADWRHPNGSLGINAEAYNQVIGSTYTFTLETGTTSVYKVAPITGAFDPKRNLLMAWAGRYVMTEKSMPQTGNILTDNDKWHFCYALRAGECRLNSAAGSFYVAAPDVDTSINQCHSSQNSYRSLCVFSGGPVFGQIMQVRIDRDDASGLWQRKLGFGLTRPGSQYVYSKAKPFSNGRAILATAWNLQGVYSTPIFIQLPFWRQDTPDGFNRTTFYPVTVQAPAGSYVEFGYEEFGKPEEYFCTPRRETCKVSAQSIIESNPFSWAADSLTASTGSSIAVPALPGRVLCYRVVTGGVPGGLLAVPVP